jgi:phospholipid-transporting ATPase
MTNSVMALNVEVSMQIQKLIYTYFIESDAQMTVEDYAGKDIKHCKVRNLNMLEETAQIDYLFCDKTGTLTKNELVFKNVAFFHQGRMIAEADATNLGSLVKRMQNKEAAEMFLLCVNLNHDCVVVDTETKDLIKFNGSSTDEVCFLEMAHEIAELGYFCDRDSDNLMLQIRDKVSKFKVLKQFPFSSDRKRSSIVVQDETG